MNNFLISRTAFSQFFWNQIGYGTPLAYGIEQELEALREKADYKTGSLSDQDVYDLGGIVRYFKPTAVCEIGTFIGRSTHTIAANMDSGIIWTCDMSNDLTLPAPLNPAVSIRQFPKTSSTQMLGRATNDKQKFDMFYIDGRLSIEDVEYIMACEEMKGALIVCDDFEGVEKGVANASVLMNALTQNGWEQTLIYPRGNHKTAVIMPFNKVQFVTQV